MRSLALGLVLVVAVPAFAQRNGHRCPSGQVFDAQARKCKAARQARPAETPSVAVEQPQEVRGPRSGDPRIEFETKHMTGQLLGAEGLYLYDRKELTQKSMVKQPDSFREELYGSL